MDSYSKSTSSDFSLKTIFILLIAALALSFPGYTQQINQSTSTHVEHWLGASFDSRPQQMYIVPNTSKGIVHRNAQEKDTLSAPLTISARIGVTNNGFSFVPAFTLDKPAIILETSVNWKRFSFEPQFRYSLEGEPWSYIFIYRYKIISDKKFQFTVGTHLPAVNFITKTTTFGGVETEELVAKRFLVGELLASYTVTPKFNIGMYYLYSKGVQKDTFKNGHYLSLTTGFSKLTLSKQFYLNVAPQLFYLKLDQRDGFYFSGNISLVKTNFPLSITSTLLKALQTDIAGKDFNWNVSLVYTFNKNYILKSK